MAKRRIQERQVETPAGLIQHLPPLLARVYAARGIQDPSDIQHSLDQLLPGDTLLGIDRATTCLETALHQNQHVLILGDFDADGATSTAVAVSALKAMGYQNVSFLVPNRFEFGYGLTPEIVEVAAQYQPDWIITVDNGISSTQGVEAALAHGIRVIITDHHLPGQVLPKAEAIVNPNQPNDPFPSKNLAGVGVIFYLMLALRQKLRHSGWFDRRREPNMAELLDLVALGTVADVVPLDKNNRILVQQGLKRIRAGRTRPGIFALIEVAKRDSAFIVASDLGFALGPRLNAAGRLEDMSLGIECLLAESLSEARVKAARLDELNRERRQIEDDMKAQAEVAIAKLEKSKHLPMGICLYEPDWHQGVIGLVASRVKERWHRPVVAFAQESPEVLKGSARSIPSLHIRDALDRISKKYPQLLTKFGGHAMAAGLSLELDKLSTFKQVFTQELSNDLTDEDLRQCLYTDGKLNLDEITLDTAEQLRNAGPWGQGFPEPLFHGQFDLVEQRLVGMYHLKLTLAYQNQWFDAIAFNVNLDQWPNHRCRRVYIVYQLDVNIYRERKRLQLLIEHIEPIS